MNLPYALKLTKAADSDIEAIVSPKVRVAIRVLLSELKDDQDLLDRLLSMEFGEYAGARNTERVGIRYVGEFDRNLPRRDVWRLKIWDLENRGAQFRIVYTYIPRQRWFVLLAVAPRSWNYDFAHPLTDRICCDYDRFVDKYG